MWNERKIYPLKKFEKAASKYGYLAKAFTVFGLHIHIGCSSSDDALYLMNALARFTPHFIALRVATIAAFAQTLAYYILTEKTILPNSDKYHLYQYNRFQASRHGFKGRYIDPDKLTSTTLAEDISTLCTQLEPYAEKLGNTHWHQKLNQNSIKKYNDARYLRGLHEKTNSLIELVQLQSRLWMEAYCS